MTIIVPAQSSLSFDVPLAVPLPAYAAIIGIPECGVFGVNNPNDPQKACRTIWTKDERDMIQRYLAEAQIEVEDRMKYFLRPQWVVGKLEDANGQDERFVDSKPYRAKAIVARWTMIISGGVKATSTIQAGAAVNHAADPAVITVATSVTDVNEIVIYHPGTEVEIYPSSISIAGGVATIRIPRCRMVLASLENNSSSGIAYSVVANFEATVDVVRIYNDISTNAELVWTHSCTASCQSGGCSETTQDGCITVRKQREGLLDVLPAVYSGSSWSFSTLDHCDYGMPEFVRLNYYSGVYANRKAQDAIVRLAHSKMPTEPCGCDITRAAWKRDRNVPQVLTRERMNCDFGMSDGAWIAWQFASSSTLVRGGRSI